MDQHKLRSLVFEKTGVRVDIDDPIFALVALNEAVLAETVERHVALIENASRELASHARAAGGLAPMTAAAAGVAASRLAGTEDETAAVFGEAAPAVSAAPAAAATAPAAPMAYSPAPAAPVRAIATQSPTITPRELRLLAAAAGISILSALLVLAGQAIFFKPVAPPAPIVQAKTLTPEQAEAIATGEKLSKAIQKLDPKTRSQLQAELQK
jgi:hypothetical protein